MRLLDVILRDTRANQPAATDVATGSLYYVTDEFVTERSSGSAWEDYSDGGTSVAFPSLAQGDLLYASGVNTPAALAKDTNATRYLSNTGASNNPAWAQVNVANGVTGTLPIGNAGTGLTTYAQGDLLYASASNTLAKLAKDTNATRYLSNTGASNAPTWAQVDVSNGVTGTLPIGNAGTGLTTYTQGDLLYASAANTLAKLAKDANATRYLSNTGSSNAPAWAQVDVSNGVTGTLPIGNAGTGLTTYTQGDLLYASAANTLAKLAKDTNASRYLSNTGASNAPAWAQVSLVNGVTGNLPVGNQNSGTNATVGSFWRGDGAWSSSVLQAPVAGWARRQAMAWVSYATNVQFGVGAPTLTNASKSPQSGGAFDFIGGSSSGTVSSWIITETFCELDMLPRMVFRVLPATTVADIRIWIGFGAASPTNSDTAPNNFVGFRFSSVAGDAGWVGVCKAAGSQSVTSSIASCTASTQYFLEIVTSAAGATVTFNVYDISGVLQGSQSLSTNLPSATQAMGFARIAVIPQIAALRGVLLHYVYGDAL